MKCPCSSGYFDNNTKICLKVPLVCSTSCTSCSNVAANCTSCNATNRRILVSSDCVCKSGFYSTSVTDCKEICGNGLMASNDKECDDGNTNNGDGCSSICTI